VSRTSWATALPGGRPETSICRALLIVPTPAIDQAPCDGSIIDSIGMLPSGARFAATPPSST
jgi:hypothetical protein